MEWRFIVVIVLAITMFFSNLGGNSVYILDEAKNAGCAMEMAQRSDLVVPTFNNELRTDKPVLHYYFMIISYKLFGVTPFAARFFSAICGVLMILVVYRGVLRILNENIAFLTCLILLSSAQIVVQFHLAVPDPYLILFMTVSLFSFYYGFHHDARFLRLCYAAVAFGFLTKGLIAVALPGAICLVHLILNGELKWSTMRRLQIWQGLLIFCAIGLPWYIAVWRATNGQWIRGFFIEHNFQRYTDTMEGHGGFPLAPFAILLVALLPFSVFIVQAVLISIRQRRQQRFLVFCITTCVVIAGFFSFSRTILPSYPAPAIPFLAIILGSYLSKLSEVDADSRKTLAISIWVNTVICVALPVVGYFILAGDPEMQNIKFISLIFLVLPLGAVLGWRYFLAGKMGNLTLSWALSWMALILLFFYVAYPAIDRQNPVSQSLAVISSLRKTHSIVGYRLFNSAYVFRLEQPFPTFESQAAIDSLINKQTKIVVLTQQKYAVEFPEHSPLKVVYRHRDLFESSETVILAN